MKKNAIACALLAGSSIATAKSIVSYDKLVAALRTGHTVNAVIDVDKCTFANNDQNTWEVKTLGARFNHIYERVGADVTHGKKMRLVATSGHDYVGRESADLIRTLYRIFEDGTTEVITQTIDPVTYNVKANKFLICQLTADGSGGVSLMTVS